MLKRIYEFKNKKCISLICSGMVIIGVLGYYLLRFYSSYTEGINNLFKSQMTDILVVIVFLILFLLFNEKQQHTEYYTSENILILVVSFIIVADARFQLYDNLKFSILDWFIIIVVTICWSVIIRTAVSSISSLNYLDFFEDNKDKAGLKLFVFILLCWLPYIICFYPGATSWDGVYQLNQFEGVVNLSNKNPVVITAFMGILVRIGNIYSSELGLFLYNIIQTLFLVWVLSYGLSLMIKYKVSKRCFSLVTLVIVIIPIPLFFNYVLLKDGFYSSFVTLFCLQILRNVIEGDKIWDKKYYCVYAVAILGTLFFRKNGIYIVLIAVVAHAIYSKQWKKILLALMCCLAIYKTTDFYIEDIRNIESGSSAEILSLPLQQLARLYIEDSNAYSKTELETITKAFDIGKASEVYIEYLSDPVKGQYIDVSDEIKFKIIGIWIKKFFQYPRVYIEAFLGNANSYLDPTGRLVSERGFFFINRMQDDDAYTFEYKNLAMESVRVFCQNVFGSGESIPIIGVLFCPGLYFLLLVYVHCVFLRRGMSWIVLVPLYVTFLVCLASPVNGAVRYVLPIIEMMPFLLLICTSGIIENKYEREK